MKIGLSLAIDRSGGGPSGPVYDVDAAALFARMSSQPDAAHKGYINTAIVALKSAGIWALRDAIWVPAVPTAQAAALNWKQNLYNLTAPSVGGSSPPSFVADRGYTGDAATMYMLTGLKPGAGGLSFVRDSANVSVYVRNAFIGANLYDLGIYDGASGTLVGPLAGNQIQLDLNDALSATGVASGALPGMYSVERNTSTTLLKYKNGASLGTEAVASVALSGTQDFYILAANLSGGPTGFSPDNVAYVAVGGYLGPTLVAQEYSIMQAYMTSIGANV